jgi:hypothetical protein
MWVSVLAAEKVVRGGGNASWLFSFHLHALLIAFVESCCCKTGAASGFMERSATVICSTVTALAGCLSLPKRVF